MSLASRTKVLSVFKTLLRTREKVFDGDDHALKCKEEYDEVNMYGKRIKVCFGLHHGERILNDSKVLLECRNISKDRDSNESLNSTKSNRKKLRNHAKSVPVEKFKEFRITDTSCNLLSMVGTLFILNLFYGIRIMYAGIHVREFCLFEVSSILLTLVSWISFCKSEYLLVMPGFGVQIASENMLGKAKKAHVVKLENVKGFVITETIKMQRVVTFLAILLHDPTSDVIREKIKEEFRKHAHVADPAEIQNLIKIANESNDILLKKVVQAREIRPNVYSIRKEDLQTKCVGARETCADCTCGRADIKI